ncbi:hypothetical protein M407DRAFT_12915 [Tulasnella calospora MUT 4182]|uniref:Uncharacterized protein n=1 Tax=Tulasnella calospora MUT 4182 TaxID=1051891 RepID=A0A0C3K481_9AGAM|nr:hypothetical protein M407DRAFT_12915 [Tulasnella calospora MUT 4182]
MERQEGAIFEIQVKGGYRVLEQIGVFENLGNLADEGNVPTPRKPVRFAGWATTGANLSVSSISFANGVGLQEWVDGRLAFLRNTKRNTGFQERYICWSDCLINNLDAEIRATKSFRDFLNHIYTIGVEVDQKCSLSYDLGRELFADLTDIQESPYIDRLYTTQPWLHPRHVKWTSGPAYPVSFPSRHRGFVGGGNLESFTRSACLRRRDITSVPDSSAAI